MAETTAATHSESSTGSRFHTKTVSCGTTSSRIRPEFLQKDTPPQPSITQLQQLSEGRLMRDQAGLVILVTLLILKYPDVAMWLIALLAAWRYFRHW